MKRLSSLKVRLKVFFSIIFSESDGCGIEGNQQEIRARRWPSRWCTIDPAAKFLWPERDKMKLVNKLQV